MLKAYSPCSKTSPAYRSGNLNKIADTIEANLQNLGMKETIGNGKAIRESVNVDLPLVINHFSYFASVIRAEKGTISEHDEDRVSICLHAPIGVIY